MIVVPHSLVRGMKNVLSVAIAIDYPIAALEKLKSAGPAPAAAAAPAAQEKAAPKKEEKKEEPKEEEDEDMGFGLFD
jgi:ribosomal protein L12E/L44/L45/RPP1/RPP2